MFNKVIEIIKNNRGFWSGLGTGMLSFASDILSGRSARQAQEEANELSRELYYADREWNKPINQVQRLKEAGLNPNLIYGGGGVVAGNTSKGAPKMESIGGYDINFASAIGAASALMSMDKVKQEIENLKVDNEIKEAEVVAAGIRNKIAQHDADVILNSPFSSQDKGTVPAVTRAVFNAMGKLHQKIADDPQAPKDVVKAMINKPLTNMKNNVSMNKSSRPWLFKFLSSKANY